jgi:hypothetical protein
MTLSDWPEHSINVAQNVRQVDGSNPAYFDRFHIVAEITVFDVEMNRIGSHQEHRTVDKGEKIYSILIPVLKLLAKFAAERLNAWRRGYGGYRASDGGCKLQEVRTIGNKIQNSMGKGSGESESDGCGRGTGFQ